jgi:hypothetical protein
MLESRPKSLWVAPIGSAVHKTLIIHGADFHSLNNVIVKSNSSRFVVFA